MMVFKTKKTIYLLLAVLSLLVLIFTLPAGACTGYVVVGEAAGGKPIFHKIRDSGDWREVVALVIPAEGDGYKYLAIQGETERKARGIGYGESSYGGINEKGVGGATFACTSTKDQWLDKGGWAPSECAAYATKYGGTAEEYISKFGEAVDEHGVISGGSGGASIVIDPYNAWQIEYTGKLWEIEGPIIDYLVRTNVYEMSSMKKYEGSSINGMTSSITRKRRAIEIIESVLFPAPPGEKWERTWCLENALDFARDKNNPVNDRPGHFYPIVSTQPWGMPGSTVGSTINIPNKEYPDLLSVVWWALDKPTIAPFIPLYIGITELPNSIDADGDFEVPDTFNKLRLLVYEDLTEREPLVRNIWSRFEIRQMQRVLKLEDNVRALAKDGNKIEAQGLLNEFLKSQITEALEIANELIINFEKY